MIVVGKGSVSGSSVDEELVWSASHVKPDANESSMMRFDFNRLKTKKEGGGRKEKKKKKEKKKQRKPYIHTCMHCSNIMYGTCTNRLEITLWRFI